MLFISASFAEISPWMDAQTFLGAHLRNLVRTKYFWPLDHFLLFQNSMQKCVLWIFTNVTMSATKNNNRIAQHCGNATGHCPDTSHQKL